MNESASKLVIDLAQLFLEQLPHIASDWTRAFFRFIATDDHYGSSASYVTPQDVMLVSAMKYGGFYDRMNDLGFQLRRETENNGRKFCVFLLVVDAAFNYEIKFEYRDIEKWKITKLDGASGMPAGLQ